jgi:hypothetical protein
VRLKAIHVKRRLRAVRGQTLFRQLGNRRGNAPFRFPQMAACVRQNLLDLRVELLLQKRKKCVTDLVASEGFVLVRRIFPVCQPLFLQERQDLTL